MKKSFILAVAISTFAATASLAQNNTSSTSGTQQPADKAGQTVPAADQKPGAQPTAPAGNAGGTGTPATPSTNTGTESSTNASAGNAAAGTNASAGNAAAGTNAGGESAAGAEGGASAPAAAGGVSRPAEGKNENPANWHSESAKRRNKSILNSEEAVERRERNLGEADTTLKKGSGSAPRNMEDKAGKTGNYRNQEIKHNQKTQPRP